MPLRPLLYFPTYIDSLIADRQTVHILKVYAAQVKRTQ